MRHLRSRARPLAMAPRALAAALVALALLAVLPGEAEGHASLIAAEPADGAVVETAPSRLVLRFNEPVAPIFLRLMRPDGETTELTTFAPRDQAVEITPPRDLAGGTHVLSWRVVSADGHPVGGALVFSVGTPTAAGDRPSGGADAATDVGLWLTRVLLYAGSFVGVGGAFFAAWIAAAGLLGATRRAVIGATFVGLLASALSVGFHGADVLAAPATALAGRQPWAAGLNSTYAVTAGLAAVALLCALAASAVADLRPARALSLAAMLCLGCAFGASGHASTAAPQWLTRPSVFIHTAAVAFWIGALVPLLAALAGKEPPSAAVMRRFSAAILPAAAVLVAAGVVLSVVQLGAVEALWRTPYGNILGLKLLAVLALLTLAAVNRLVLTPALARRALGAAHRFARSIAAELVLVAAILGLVAGWRFTPPPRAAVATVPEARAPRRASLHIHTDKGMAEVTLEEAAGGRATARLILTAPSGQPMRPKAVTLALSNEAAGIEPVEREARKVDEGRWQAEGLAFPVTGRWQVRIDVLLSDFDKLTLDGAFEAQR